MLMRIFEMALDIAVNAKVQRPSVCNSMETLLVHEGIAKEFLVALEKKLASHHVTIMVRLRCYK